MVSVKNRYYVRLQNHCKMGIELFLLKSPVICVGLLFFGAFSAFVFAEPDVNPAEAIVQKYPERTERLLQAGKP